MGEGQAKGKQVDIDLAPTNYTETGSDVEGHLGGIDSKFGAEDIIKNETLSAGRITGGAISKATAGTYDVASGNGLFRTSDSPTAALVRLSWSTLSAQPIAADETRFVGVDYNAGSPIVVTKASNVWNYNTEYPLGRNNRDSGTDHHITNAPHQVGDHPGLIDRRFFEVLEIARDNTGGGLILGETGTRNITMDAGALWVRIQRFAITAINTSVSDTFDRYYRDGVGGFTKEAAETQWPNTQFDDGSGTLAILANNRFGTLWFYIGADGALSMLYGRVEHQTQAAAEGEAVPGTIPDHFDGHAKLIARLIFEKSAATAALISSLFDIVLSSQGVTAHGDLSGLTNDDHPQYLLIDGSRAMTGSLVTAFLVDGRDVSVDGATLDAHVADLANPHATDIENLGSGTLAELNAAITDATLDDSGASRTPLAHAATHAPAGGDSLSGIDHDTQLINVGTNTHAQIDTHLADTANPHSTTFLGLGDTPGAFTARNAFRVNAAGTAIELAVGGQSIGLNAMTGVLVGGNITNGVSAGQVTISNGDGHIVVYTTPVTPTFTSVSWSGLTNIALTNIATTQSTFLLINSGGSLVQISGSIPTETQLRENIFLGWVTHPDNINVDAIVAEPRLAYAAGQDYRLFSSQFDPFVLNGIEISGNPATLQFQYTAGELYAEGINFHTNPANPSVSSVSALNPVVFDRVFSDGTDGGETRFDATNVTLVDPLNYDVVGTLTLIPGSTARATLQRVYLDPAGNIYVAYGQAFFNSLTDAIVAAGKESFNESALMKVSTLMGYWVVTKGATDLDDPTEAEFIPINTGSGGGGGGGSGVTTYLQLTDTPVGFSGDSLKVVRVNVGESALEHHTLVHADLGSIGIDDHHARDHAAAHSNGGADEVTVENLGTAIVDTTLVLKPTGGGAVGFGSSAHGDLTGVTANQHHNENHAARHADGGADELQVENLATASVVASNVLQADGVGGTVMADLTHAELAGVGTDDHHAQAHAAAHSDGGADEVVAENLATGSVNTTHSLQPDGVGGTVMTTTAHVDLTGISADQHHAQNHASRHADGGADEIEISGLPTSEVNTALVLKPDGVGGIAWGAQAATGIPVARVINLFNTSLQNLSTSITALLWTADRVKNTTHFSFTDNTSIITVLTAGTYSFRAFVTARPDSVIGGTGLILHFLVNGGGGLTSAKPRVDFNVAPHRRQNYIEVTRNYDANDQVQIAHSVTSATTGDIEANTVGLTGFFIGTAP